MSRRILNCSDDETVLWVLLEMCLGVLTIFNSQNHFYICRGILLLEKLWAGRSA